MQSDGTDIALSYQLFSIKDKFKGLEWFNDKTFLTNIIIFFYVFSTVHHSIGLFLQPTLMYNSITHVCHITILDMFRALTCPSSGGTTAHTQHLVSSLF